MSKIQLKREHQKSRSAPKRAVVCELSKPVWSVCTDSRIVSAKATYSEALKIQNELPEKSFIVTVQAGQRLQRFNSKTAKQHNGKTVR